MGFHHESRELDQEMIWSIDIQEEIDARTRKREK
jgi:hypothetical protein